MTVKISEMMSIVVRKDGRYAQVKPPVDFGGLVSEDGDLVVYGPFYSADDRCSILDALGYEYTVDYFDVPDSGGTVPGWVSISLSLRRE